MLLTMYDLFSRLPAELSLQTLMQLPDLKALYCAILSSPHLYAVFCLESHCIFEEVMQRCMSEEMLAPLVLYMRVMHACHHSQCSWQELKTAAASTQDIWRDMPRAVIFHTIAQAVRICDLAYFVLRSKLDYLGTLTCEKLADPTFSYDRSRPMSVQHPEGLWNVQFRMYRVYAQEEEREMGGLATINATHHVVVSFLIQPSLNSYERL